MSGFSKFSAHEPDIQILQFARGIQHYKCGVLRNFEEKETNLLLKNPLAFRESKRSQAWN